LISAPAPPLDVEALAPAVPAAVGCGFVEAAAEAPLVVAAAGALVAALPPHPAIANAMATRPADAVIVRRFMGFSC
jgi:hypothetical protein